MIQVISKFDNFIAKRQISNKASYDIKMFSQILRQFNTYFLYDKNSLKPFFEFKIWFKRSKYFEIWSISKSFKVLQD